MFLKCLHHFASHQQQMKASSAGIDVNFLDCNHSNKCAVVSHYCFLFLFFLNYTSLRNLCLAIQEYLSIFFSCLMFVPILVHVLFWQYHMILLGFSNVFRLILFYFPLSGVKAGSWVPFALSHIPGLQLALKSYDKNSSVIILLLLLSCFSRV